MERLIALLTGLIFGIGLLLAQMTDPRKVLGFLDVFGRWDPSLALVMGGAIALAMPFFTYARKRTHSLSGHIIQLPTNHSISRRLVLGSLLFGAGWGLAGLCPAPALVVAATGNLSALLFVIFMLLGFALFGALEAHHQRHTVSHTK